MNIADTQRNDRPSRYGGLILIFSFSRHVPGCFRFTGYCRVLVNKHVQNMLLEQTEVRNSGFRLAVAVGYESCGLFQGFGRRTVGFKQQPGLARQFVEPTPGRIDAVK